MMSREAHRHRVIHFGVWIKMSNLLHPSSFVMTDGAVYEPLLGRLGFNVGSYITVGSD
jgi:hypothetical protein